MNHERIRKTVGAWRALAVAALVGTTAHGAVAGSHFTTGTYATSVICSIEAIKGDFTAVRAQYQSNGHCAELSVSGNSAESKFPGDASSKVLFQAPWTAQASYNPTTRETLETITLPAPREDERRTPDRPVGVFTSRMICATDPWLETGSVKCTSVSVQVSGNLGNAETLLRSLAQPFTRPQKALQRDALIAAHDNFVKSRAALFSQKTDGSRPGLTTYTLPEIVEPRTGVVYPQQTPLKVRVTPPRNLKVRTYLVQFEVLENGAWKTGTNEPVIASELEGPLGYKGWGWHRPGTSAQSTAYPGTWRVRAQATTPDQGEAGAWRVFTIGNEIGAQPDMAAKSPVLPGLGRGAAGTGASTLTTMGATPNAPNTAIAARSALKTDRPLAIGMPQPMAPMQAAPAAADAKKPTLDWGRASTSATPSSFSARTQP